MSESCLIPTLILWLSASHSRTTASTSASTVNSLPGCLTFFVQEISSAWRKASIPSSNAMKAPMFVIFTTLPDTFVPTAYLSAIVSHGLSVVCLRPSETRPA